MESVPDPVEEEAPITAVKRPETPVQQHHDVMREEEEPMEQQEPEPVIQDETADAASEVCNNLNTNNDSSTIF